MRATFGKFWRLGGSVGVFGAFALAGCNAILGNEEGTPRVAAQGDSGTTPSGSLDGGTGGGAVDGGLVTTKECDPGERRCFGLCKRQDDPSVGCASDACTACDPKNVQGAATCTGSSAGFGCDYASCDPAFLDCDGSRSNGCETSKNNKDNCGACGNKCQMGTPLCANNGGTFSCAASCPMGTTQCDNACVDITQDASNCGGCGIVCKRVNATAKCAASACSYTCNAGTKDCSGACVAMADPKFCLNCSPCPVYANTIATCRDGTRCAYECMPGFYDCDGKPSTGCESNKECGGLDLCGGLLCPAGQKCCGLTCVPENSLCAPAQL